MGFIYKLTPQISAFIIEQKQSQPKATCQAISGMILTRFGQHVSKSSVHFLLKQSQVIVPRARKVKEKFEIPSHKKQEISKALAPFASTNLLQSAPIKQEIIPVKADHQLPSNLKPLHGRDAQAPAIKEVVQPVKELKVRTIKTVGDIFLKCALYDLSLKPIFGIQEFEDINKLEFSKVRFEWQYLTGQVYSIKIQLIDDRAFYIDPRFQGIYAMANTRQELAAPIERVAVEVADYILNNIKPLILRNIDVNSTTETIYDFISSMNNIENKKIRNISLLDENQKTLAEFNHPLICPRYYIIGIDSKLKQFEELKEIIRQNKELTIFETDNGNLITNLKQMTYEETKELHAKRHPKAQLNISVNHSIKIINQQPSLKTKICQRALMFFPSGVTQQELEQILELKGFEDNSVDGKNENIQRTTLLQSNVQSPRLAQIQYAIDNINALNITNYKAQKMILTIQVDSD